jgi:hypothetical protein
MEMEQWLLPGAIIFVKFLLKLFIDRQVDLPEFIQGVLALPFDVAFLASALLAGLIIIDAEQVKIGLGMFVVSLAIGILSLFLCRRAEASFAKEHYRITATLFVINAVITFGAAAYVVQLLAKGAVT